MSTKKVVSTLLLASILVMMLAAVAQASIEPVVAVETLTGELSQADLDGAMDCFTEHAVVVNKLDNRTYVDEEIADILTVWERPGRTYDIVSLNMDGDTVTVTLDVADKGWVWGQQRMTAATENGKISDLSLDGFRLQYFPTPSK